MREETRRTVLVVDDTEANVDILVEALSDEYDVAVAMDGPSALDAVAHEPPDLVLLDIMMPGMDGYEVCSRLKEDGRDELPVLFITALGDMASKAKAFEAGGVDYITKPFEIQEVKARVRTHLSLLEARRKIRKHNEELEEKVRERTRELRKTQDVTLESLALLAEYRDLETGEHIRRTQLYVRLLVSELRREGGPLAELLDRETAELLWVSAPLHDIGKVGIPDSILLKPAKLDKGEFEIMKRHTVIGHDTLLRAEKKLGSNSFLRVAREIAYSHHEKWDGGGYPRGLSGDDIPLSGRLMAIADVYDALVSRRAYKAAFPETKAAAIILEGKGSHFDPRLVDIFERRYDAFKRISDRFADKEIEDDSIEARIESILRHP